MMRSHANTNSAAIAKNATVSAMNSTSATAHSTGALGAAGERGSDLVGERDGDNSPLERHGLARGATKQVPPEREALALYGELDLLAGEAHLVDRPQQLAE